MGQVPFIYNDTKPQQLFLASKGFTGKWYIDKRENNQPEDGMSGYPTLPPFQPSQKLFS